MSKNRKLQDDIARETIKPITGNDLELFRLTHSLNIGDMCWLLGVTRAKWKELVKGEKPSPNRKSPVKATDPLKDSGMASLIRIYDENPNLIPIPPRPDMIRIKELMGGDDIGEREFALIFNREPAASYRWLDPDKATRATSTVTERLAQIAMRVDNPRAFLRRAAEREAKARGADPFTNGTWRVKNRKAGT